MSPAMTLARSGGARLISNLTLQRVPTTDPRQSNGLVVEVGADLVLKLGEMLSDPG
jgi:hypothetical protein